MGSSRFLAGPCTQSVKIGTSGGIRTPDNLLRRQVLWSKLSYRRKYLCAEGWIRTTEFQFQGSLTVAPSFLLQNNEEDSNPTLPLQTKRPRITLCSNLVGEVGLEPTGRKAGDLQSLGYSSTQHTQNSIIKPCCKTRPVFPGAYGSIRVLPA